VDNSDPRIPAERRYSVLVAVPLSPTTAPFTGNLCVIPEAHERVYDLLLDRIKKVPPPPPPPPHSSQSSSSGGGGGSGSDFSDELDMNKPDLGEPLQLLAAPGDVILLPGELAPHRDSPNYSCDIRYMVPSPPPPLLSRRPSPGLRSTSASPSRPPRCTPPL
jgi:hypothetical protein